MSDISWKLIALIAMGGPVLGHAQPRGEATPSRTERAVIKAAAADAPHITRAGIDASHGRSESPYFKPAMLAPASRGQAATIGFFVGALAGGAYVAVQCSKNDCMSPMPFVIFGLGGGFLGALVGLLLGPRAGA
ncbi:MAG: hypothetical protein ACT4OZ_03035 [Gemmatimonadota bacterium]